MATKIDDPITGTNWFDPNDLSGTAMTWVVAIVGIGILFTVISVAQSTVQPAASGLVNSLPFVSTGGNQIRVAQ